MQKSPVVEQKNIKMKLRIYMLLVSGMQNYYELNISRETVGYSESLYHCILINK